LIAIAIRPNYAAALDKILNLLGKQ
jgi:hypothetical protein